MNTYLVRIETIKYGAVVSVLKMEADSTRNALLLATERERQRGFMSPVQSTGTDLLFTRSMVVNACCRKWSASNTNK